ncbi:MAG: hypothetical protein ACD_73C00718G0008 [uncultured bacterium]|nr:MAG: hypothetical protein ACD_73C00718G0008 [uncultured bacterium]
MPLMPQKLDFINPFDFKILWNDSHESVYHSRNVRLECPCAKCVNEFTREKMLDPDSIAMDVHPIKLDYVGRYALLIKWSDSHDTGYYTFDHLRTLCECEHCKKPA